MTQNHPEKQRQNRRRYNRTFLQRNFKALVENQQGLWCHKHMQETALARVQRAKVYERIPFNLDAPGVMFMSPGTRGIQLDDRTKSVS